MNYLTAVKTEAYSIRVIDGRYTTVSRAEQPFKCLCILRKVTRGQLSDELAAGFEWKFLNTITVCIARRQLRNQFRDWQLLLQP